MKEEAKQREEWRHQTFEPAYRRQRTRKERAPRVDLFPITLQSIVHGIVSSIPPPLTEQEEVATLLFKTSTAHHGCLTD